MHHRNERVPSGAYASGTRQGGRNQSAKSEPAAGVHDTRSLTQLSGGSPHLLLGWPALAVSPNGPKMPCGMGV